MFMPPLDNTTRSLLDGIGKYKSLRVYFIDQVLQFSKFHPGDHGEDDITVGTYFELTGQKSPFSFVYGDAPAQVIHQLVFDHFALSGNDGDAGMGLYAFHDVIDTPCCGKVGEYGIEGGFDTELESGNGKDDDINSQYDLGDGERCSFQRI